MSHSATPLSPTAPPPLVWVVSEGMAGTENQCLGIAEALGVTPVVKRITLRQPWKLLSPYLRFECAASFREPLTGPWPDLLIASGRKSIAASRYIKKMSGGKTFTVQVQDPRVSPHHFDMVVVPEHDPTRGENVFVSTATPNRITAEKLAQAREDFAFLFSGLLAPRVAVLIGGTTKTHKFSKNEAVAIAKKLSPYQGLMITTSRRTGDESTAFLKSVLDIKGNYFWDGKSPNPYQGFLAWADAIIVTADSTSMLSEASTTGKPVYVLPMEGLSRRQSLLVENLIARGAVRPFNGKIENWTYEPLADSSQIAAEIRQRSGLFGEKQV